MTIPTEPIGSIPRSAQLIDAGQDLAAELYRAPQQACFISLPGPGRSASGSKPTRLGIGVDDLVHHG